MIYDGKPISDAERLRVMADMEHEECEALEAMVPAPPVDIIHEIEKLSAGELVMRARNLDSYLPRLDNIDRGRTGQAFRRVAAELLEAARKCDRFIPDELPDFYREGSDVPLRRIG